MVSLTEADVGELYLTLFFVVVVLPSDRESRRQQNVPECEFTFNYRVLVVNRAIGNVVVAKLQEVKCSRTHGAFRSSV